MSDITPEQIKNLIDVCDRQSKHIDALKQEVVELMGLTKSQKVYYEGLIKETLLANGPNKVDMPDPAKHNISGMVGAIRSLFNVDILQFLGEDFDSNAAQQEIDKLLAVNTITDNAKLLELEKILVKYQNKINAKLNKELDAAQAGRKSLDNVVTTFAGQYSSQFPVMHSKLLTMRRDEILSACNQDPVSCNATLNFASPRLLGLDHNDTSTLQAVQRGHALSREQLESYDQLGKREKRIMAALLSNGEKCRMAKQYVSGVVNLGN